MWNRLKTHFSLLFQFHENFVYVAQLFPGVGDWWKDLRFIILRFHISCGPVSQGMPRFPSLDKYTTNGG
jgi:hypothetical protein